MADRDQLLQAARETRETAARVRRIAQRLSLNADHERLMRQAAELELEAQHLERQAAGDEPTTPPPVRRGMPMQQQQVQQQQHEEPAPEEKPPAKS